MERITFSYVKRVGPTVFPALRLQLMPEGTLTR